MFHLQVWDDKLAKTAEVWAALCTAKPHDGNKREPSKMQFKAKKKKSVSGQIVKKKKKVGRSDFIFLFCFISNFF